jgi:hypothetical protein
MTSSHPASGTDGSSAPAQNYRRGAEGSGERVVVAPPGSPVELLARLAAEVGDPFVVVYVLIECHTFRPEGRYQSPSPLSRGALEKLLGAFKAFLEEDGRHGLWIMSGAEPATLSLDRRGVVTAYGPPGRFPAVLEKLGYREGPVSPGPARVRVPQHDASEMRMLAAMPWQWNALEPGDEYLEE